jgi:protein SCO1/2
MARRLDPRHLDPRHLGNGPGATRRPARTRRALSLGAVLVATGVLAACGSSGNGASTVNGATITQAGGSSQTSSKYPGAIVLPATSVAGKPRVTLTDTSGQPYDVAAATRGKVTLVYFGYTHCPDVCPINTLAKMPAADRAAVTVVFITTDPRRDTPKVIRAWLDNFDPSFVGLTGSIAQIDTAEHQVGMPLSFVESSPTSTSSGYEIEHAGYLLAYSQDNRAHLEFFDNESAPDFATSLDHLVKSGFEA